MVRDVLDVKKIMALVCCLLLILSLVAGCGSKQEAPKSQPSQQTTMVERQQGLQLSGDEDTTAANVKANSQKISVSRDRAYTDKVHVAAYLNEFSKLPHNYITKGEAKKLGWKTKGSLDEVAPGKSIGGDRFGNYEGLLPKAKNRNWKECDIDYVRGNRNAKRILYSNDGLIYYTDDHYKSFTRLY